MKDRKEYMRLYRLKNKEKIKENAKKYFQENKDEIMEKRQSETYKQSQKKCEQKRYIKKILDNLKSQGYTDEQLEENRKHQESLYK
jgi:hypothetical protein